MAALAAAWRQDGPVLFRNATVPRATLAETELIPGKSDTVLADLLVAGGRLAAIRPAGLAPAGDAATVDLARRMVWPCYVDAHAHLDKGHIWARTPNPDGSFEGALESVGRDRAASWSAEDVRARMDFGLRCAYAHGTSAIRTHLDSDAAQAEISWGVFRETRAEWAGRIALQAVSLISVEALRDAEAAERLADLVSRSGGLFGAVSYRVPDLEALLDRLFDIATRYGLALDLHVDENDDPAGASLGLIAETLRRHRFAAPVSVAHCCSIALQDAAAIDRTLDSVAAAGITVITLPSCNLYLQDRHPGRTPRWRGVTLLHEMRARGIDVVVAGDNCRDPFFAYGDHDMAEVFRDAARISHLDHPFGEWPAAVNRWPAKLMGLSEGSLATNGPADLVIFEARSFNELLSRPRGGRLVMRDGKVIDTAPPDYAKLDPLFEPS